jgi:hypothetical protein
MTIARPKQVNVVTFAHASKKGKRKGRARTPFSRLEERRGEKTPITQETHQLGVDAQTGGLGFPKGNHRQAEKPAAHQQ